MAAIAQAGRDYYDILDVPRDAPKSLIKQHFKKLSRVYHPDKNPGDSSASDKFMEIAQAYEILSNDDKRNTYDRYGEEGVKKQEQQQQNAGQNPFGNIFGQFFNGGHQGKPKTPNIEIPLHVSLEDVYSGVNIEVDVAKHVTCDHCFGSGAHNSDSIRTCSTCQGQGSTLKQVQFAPGFVQQFQQQCATCAGKGKTIITTCKACYGRKIKRGNEQYTVVVDKGMSTDQTIVFEEEANEAPDKDPGDIIFKIITSKHPVFERHGNDLHTNFTITLIEALTGFSKFISHLDQSAINFKRSGVTQYGLVDKIIGAGMPIIDNHDEYGDLYVKYLVKFPEHVDSEFLKDLKNSVFKPTHDEL
ncbi:hypothetical protein INT47_009356 [Mucor saturninus]|uniref:DnaJ-domain-containing protein n=1 Tax=Mucor saturninus TaxID=64648 RepID=A0A8H7R4D2_9FUNG|nr:hypothetical protein INT47_009356 [Mucor saturninus]